MKRLLLDQGLPRGTARLLNAQGWEVVHAGDVGMSRASEAKCRHWPNGADFDPETLHDWPQMLPSLTQQAQPWKLAA